MMEKKKVTLIVPCYNEEESLPIFYEAAAEVTASLPAYDFQFLLVNDGSKDKTLDVMRMLAARDPRVTYLSFSRNFGKEAAMFAGFVNAKGDYVAVMDADMQDPPSLLPQMLEILEGGEYDSVATRRVSRVGEPPIRSFFARMFYRIINRISDADVVDGARDFQLMRREMVDAIKGLSGEKQNARDYLDIYTMWFRDVLMFKATKEIDSLIFKEEVSAIRQRAGESSYEGIQKILDAIRQADDRLRANVNFDLTMELLYLTMKEN